MAKHLKTVLIVVASVTFLAISGFFLIGYLGPKPGGILVITDPPASVYINGALSGDTPFKKFFDSGEITLKVVPKDANQKLFPFETKVTLVPGVQTVIRREFGVDDDTSSGDVISFEKGDSSTSMVVVSTPDNAQVSIDGIPRGFAPYKTSSISPAEHQVTIKSPGFTDRVMTIKTVQGYRLTLFAKLAKTQVATTPTPTPTPNSQSYVLILDTPTGYLRVRTEPLTSGEEIAQVKPGEKYLYLDTDLASGWFKIQYEAPKPGLPGGIIGWVSNQYSKLATESANLASPSSVIK